MNHWVKRSAAALSAAAAIIGCLDAGVARTSALDLSQSALFIPPDASAVEKKAAQIFNDEVARRTQIRLSRRAYAPDAPAICLGIAAELRRSLPGAENFTRLDSAAAPESFQIWIDRSGPQPRLIVAGADDRGVLFGAGYLLRKMELNRGRLSVPDDFQAATAPKMPLRGHQLGYRQKTNSYDGWDVPMWEQYLRDLVIFGCNTIELIPPRSDDDADSPHFPLPPMEMMIEMSRLAGEYGLDVWIWYPAMDPDYSDEKTVEAALKEWAGVFRQLPRVDAVFVPGGDPGHTQPRYLFRLLEKQAASLRQYHPHAKMWVSPQSFGSEWLEEFFDLVKKEPDWLAGVAYGPQVRIPLAELRARLPQRYPIRDYPDITHSRHCQYPVPNWDLAYAITEGREAINPRPTQMARIFRATTAAYSAGFITYSEGCNDDVNKAVWSGLGWDPEANPEEIVRDYSRYFAGSSVTEPFSKLVLGLEQNWTGAIETNGVIEAHLAAARELEAQATPQQKLNWRFQQILYRAYYDAWVQRRWRHESALEAEALQKLRAAGAGGSLAALQEAEAILDRAASQPVAPELRARLFELGEALFQSVRMQLSTERYQGEPGRGSNLNEIDEPLNNRAWLKERFAQIRRMNSEPERAAALLAIANWKTVPAGSFYDDLGDPRRQPHLLRGVGWEKDPGFFHTPQVGFTDRKARDAVYPISWWQSAENLYDEPLRMHYDGLSRQGRYKLRVVYGRYKNNAPVRLMANGQTEVHGWLNRPGELLEFDLPASATASGSLDLTWFPTVGRGGNGRVLDVAEVWLLHQEGQ